VSGRFATSRPLSISGSLRYPSRIQPLLDSGPPSRPQGGAASTSQGHPRTIFRRALERDDLVLAEVTARETIAEALELTALVSRNPASTLRSLRRPLALPLARGTREGDA
jgi:hypothetical protein